MLKRSWLKRGNSVLKRSWIKKSRKTERQSLILELDDIVRQIVRLRDKVCQKTGRTEDLQCAHMISRKNHHLRWNMDNVVLLQKGTHCFWAHVHYNQFRDFMINRIGLEKVEWLEMQDRIHCKPIYTCDLKLLKADLLDKLEYYKKRDISNDKVEKLIQLIKNS